MLSRDCDGCSQLKTCRQRYKMARKGEKVYCSDGTAHLIDHEAVIQNVGLYEQQIELLQ